MAAEPQTPKGALPPCFPEARGRADTRRAPGPRSRGPGPCPSAAAQPGVRVSVPSHGQGWVRGCRWPSRAPIYAREAQETLQPSHWVGRLGKSLLRREAQPNSEEPQTRPRWVSFPKGPGTTEGGQKGGGPAVAKLLWRGAFCRCFPLASLPDPVSDGRRRVSERLRGLSQVRQPAAGLSSQPHSCLGSASAALLLQEQRRVSQRRRRTWVGHSPLNPAQTGPSGRDRASQATALEKCKHRNGNVIRLCTGARRRSLVIEFLAKDMRTGETDPNGSLRVRRTLCWVTCVNYFVSTLKQPET